MTHYLISKIWKIIYINTVLRRVRKFPGVYDFWKSECSPTSIGFDLSDSRYVHIGDQLFFEPIISHLTKHGFNVKVSPTKSMIEYFSDAGHCVVDSKKIIEQDLRISSIWMFDSISTSERARNFIYLNPADHGMILPVSNHLTKSLLAIFNIQFNENINDCRPHFVKEIYDQKIDGPIIIYNDSVDSGRFRIKQAHFNSLLEQARKKSLEGCTILRLGTKEEKTLNPRDLPFPHVDYRGMTNVIDLFKLMNTPNVIGTISFDTAIAHVALLYNKSAWISMRNFSQSHTKHVKKCIFPSYLTNSPASIFYI